MYFSVFSSCRADRQNRQQPIQGILLKVTIQNFKELPCKPIFLYFSTEMIMQCDYAFILELCLLCTDTAHLSLGRDLCVQKLASCLLKHLQVSHIT